MTYYYCYKPCNLSFSTNWVADIGYLWEKKVFSSSSWNAPIECCQVQIKRRLIKNSFPYECEPVRTRLISIFIDSVSTAINLTLTLIPLSHFQQWSCHFHLLDTLTIFHRLVLLIILCPFYPYKDCDTSQRTNMLPFSLCPYMHKFWLYVRIFFCMRNIHLI